MSALRDSLRKLLPPERLLQARALKGHLRDAVELVRRPPPPFVARPSFARTTAEAARAFRATYDALGTSAEREAALRALLVDVIADARWAQALDAPFLARELGDEVHRFAVGAGRHAAADPTGAVRAFDALRDGEHGSFARLCLARSIAVGLGDEDAVDAALEPAAAAGYLPALQERAASAYRRGEVELANARIDAFRDRLEPLVRTSSRYENVPFLDAEASAAVRDELEVRPRGPRSDPHTEALAAWAWRDIWWHMRTVGARQHGLGWLRQLQEATLEGVLVRRPAIRKVIDFGVLCAEADARVAARHPDVQFVGVDREDVTRALNEAAYPLANMRFVSGSVVDQLDALVDPGATALVHARTAALCYPAYVRRLYIECAKRGVETIVLLENNALERRSLRYWRLGEHPDLSLPYLSRAFIHDYGRLLTDAGYRIVEVSRPPYADLFHVDGDVACDGHLLVVATRA